MKKILRFLMNGLFVTVVVGQTFTFSQVVFAADDYVALTTIPGATVAGQTANPTDVVKRIYSISIGIAAILAVIMIIFGGIQYATTESVTGKGIANDHIKSAFFGLILLIGSYLILKTINSQLVNINLDLGTPVVDTVNKNNTTGGDAFSTMMDNVAKDVAQKTADLQAAEQGVQTAQAGANKLQTDLDSINNQLKGMNGATPEARALVAQALEIQQQLDAAKLKVQTEQANQISKDISQKSASVSQLAISNALSRGDVATAQKLISDARQLMQQDLDALRSNPSASAADIKLAATRVGVANVLTNKIMDAVSTISSINVSGSTENQYLDSGAVEQRQSFLDGISAVTSSGISQDPGNATAYKNNAELAQRAFDKALAQKLGCTNGILVESGIRCAK